MAGGVTINLQALLVPVLSAAIGGAAVFGGISSTVSGTASDIGKLRILVDADHDQVTKMIGHMQIQDSEISRLRTGQERNSELMSSIAERLARMESKIEDLRRANASGSQVAPPIGPVRDPVEALTREGSSVIR